jgi:hypothetical protein
VDLKQKVSILVASLLPVVALAAYFLLTPTKTSALSCPGGTFNASCYRGPGVPVGCQSGSGYCYAPGDVGYFVFCPNHPGPGDCETGGVVCCTE